MARKENQQKSKMTNWLIDRWMDGRTDGWMDGRTDGRTD